MPICQPDVAEAIQARCLTWDSPTSAAALTREAVATRRGYWYER